VLFSGGQDSATCVAWALNEFRNEWHLSCATGRGVNKSERRGKIANDERADWSAAGNLFPGEIAYVWHGALRATMVAKSLIKSGFNIRAQIVWAKERLDCPVARVPAAEILNGGWTPLQSSLPPHRSGVVLDFRSVYIGQTGAGLFR
jgi:hypothetical protein